MPALEPFDLGGLVTIAGLNPVVIVVALLMGRRADQWQKIVVAAFAASLAGFLAVWLAIRLGALVAHGIGSEAGLVALQFLAGLVWAAAGYASQSLWPKRPRP
jgi:hypothetical protein